MSIDIISLSISILFLKLNLGIIMQKTILKIPKIKTRVTWAFSPVTRVIKSKKIYDRKNYKMSSCN